LMFILVVKRAANANRFENEPLYSCSSFSSRPAGRDENEEQK